MLYGLVLYFKLIQIQYDRSYNAKDRADDLQMKVDNGECTWN